MKGLVFLSIGVIYAFCSGCGAGGNTYYLLRNKFPDMERYEIDDNMVLFTDVGNHKKGGKMVVNGLISRIKRFTRLLVANYGLSGLEAGVTLIVFNDVEGYFEYLNLKKEKKIHTPYGFYQSRERIIVVNYRAGDGTITHELVHALVEDDSKRVPIWFNEGIASLFEECVISDGRLLGVANWRFDRIKEYMNSNMNLISWLMSLDPEKFYNEDPERSYAISRLLCYFLQEKNMLTRFYNGFKKDAGDKYGISTLQALFGRRIGSIDRIFRDWVGKRFTG